MLFALGFQDMGDEVALQHDAIWSQS
jgi:hypothetical protein